ncbi:MAG: alpha/beta hydrolase family protein [Promethearchaeota archaeon]
MTTIIKEDVEIPVEKGKLHLKGSIYYKSNTRSKAPFVINLAGLLDHRESYFVKYFTEKFASAGYYVLSYDHRAHGETAKQTGKNWLKFIKEIFSDITKVITWVLNTQSDSKLLNKKIVLFGRSLGGAIILTHGFIDERAKILISLCARYDYSKFKIKFPQDVVKHISAKYFLKFDRKNNQRILIAHCKDDKRIPFENLLFIQKDLGLSNENTIIYESGGHSFKNHREDIFKESINFINRYL